MRYRKIKELYPNGLHPVSSCIKSLLIALVLVACLAGMPALHAQSSGKKPPAGVHAKEPSAASVIRMIGMPLKSVFATFGTPANVFASRGGDTDLDAAVLDYGSFGFKIRDTAVCVCYFWREWRGQINGIGIGDSRQTAERVLGSPFRIEKNDDGVDDYAWELPGGKALIWLVFNEAEAVHRVQVEFN